ncbi:MAG TPA: PfkB family carbohydrate kinase [Oligoflexia bacterium]|nr:PfkB family carbohydrate kinase [Oligoflexia bacterium]HMP49838.1 PfkB family carbohydrate kinase [Oligoflexia bacterium]
MISGIAYLEFDTIQKKITKSAAPILVFGDVMLDAYIEGSVSRISPEAPVPVLNNPSEEKYAIGGAANVAHNLVAMNNKVHLVSGIGSVSNHRESEILLGMLRKVEISTDHVVSLDRKTTVKRRIIAGKQQLLRIDSEDTFEVSGEEEELLLDAVKRASKGVGAIIISDYAKGILSNNLAKLMGDIAKTAGIPLLVDVKHRNLDKLCNVSLIKPNLKEAQQFTGISYTGDLAEIGEMAKKLGDRFSSQVVITCGGMGMVLYNGRESSHLVGPAREVFDVSGAGDTVIAALAHANIRNMSLEDSVSLATVAAGIAVSRRGTVAVRMDEIESQLSKMIVPKTWGHEEWIVNADYCGKKLVLHEGHCCSLHFHKIKDETFYIASGKVGFQMNDQFFILLPGDSLLITPGTKHRFYGLEHSEIFEFSTHHMEDDSYRDEISGTFDKSQFDGVPEYRSVR